VVVAAGAGQRRGGLGVGVTQLVGVNIVPAAAGQVGAVGREANPASATHTSRRSYQTPRSSVRMIR